MALINTQEVVERSITAALKNLAVAEGYSVAVAPYINNTAGYEAAMSVIATNKRFCIEVYGPGSTQRKGEKKVPRIVVSSDRVESGNLGNVIGPSLEVHPTDLSRLLQYQNETLTSTLALEVNLVSNTAEQNRILHAILNAAIGKRKYLPFYNDASKSFLVQQYGYYDVPDSPEGIIEKVYNLYVPDLILAQVETGVEVVLIEDIQTDGIIPQSLIPTQTNPQPGDVTGLDLNLII